MQKVKISNQNKIGLVILVAILIQIAIRLIFPIAGGESGALSLIPALLIAWFWGPWFGMAGTIAINVFTALNLFSLGLGPNDAVEDLVGITIPIILSIGFGYFSLILKKNKTLAENLQQKTEEINASLEEKIKAEKTLLEKIEFIRFSNKISSDFINIPPLLIESRIESAVRHILDLVDADACCIYTINDDDKYFTLYKELSKSNFNLPYKHFYKIELEKISDLYDTLVNQSQLEIDNEFWNHPIIEIFKSRSTVLLPLLSNDKLIGLISFECYAQQKDWSKFYQEVFPLAKQVIAYAFERKLAEEKIREQYDELKSYNESMFITNLKLNSLNETLVKTSEELKESEKKFRELAENLEDIIWLQSGNEILYVNPAYEKISGKKREDLYKNTYDFIEIIFEEDKSELFESFSKHNFSGQNVFQKDFRIYNPDGTTRWLSARSFLIGKENNELKIAGIAEDITLRKKAEEEVKIALEKSIELNQLKSRFISTVSHELRTPLATILSSIELLQLYENELRKDEKSKHFNKIIASIDYLTTLLDDVITIDKTESGIISVNYEKFDLIELINNIVLTIGTIKNSAVSMNISSNITQLEINSDKKLLTQIVNNLLTNAIKFSPPKSKVDVRVNSSENFFTLTVVDYGIGIPKEAQANIFVPFFRAANAQNIQGTGLGLSIAKKWADLLNGEISFESKHNKSTSFTVKLPIDSEYKLAEKIERN